MPSLNKNILEVTIPGTREFANKVAQLEDAIDLTLGQSGFPAPQYIKDAMIEAIENDKLRYTHNRGLIELRKAISDKLYNDFSVHYDEKTQIVVTNGGSEAIDDVFRTIINEGDEVIIPSPSYLGYEPILKLLGAKVINIDTRSTHFIPTPDAVKQAITSKTKAILFNYPTNPTGKTLSYEQIKALVEVMKDEDIFIVTDEIYSENIYDTKYHSFIEFEDVRDKLFVINGLSKSHAITGARVGYVVSTPELITHVTSVHLYNSICVATPSQYGALSALTHDDSAIKEMNKAYKARRDYLYERLINMGLPVERPNGAFYIFPDISAYNKDSYKFATDLLNAERLAVVPGSAFSQYGEGHIRLSFASTMEEIVEACNRLERFLNSY
ncbi:pyridoxal phosphate-dependent aminotransferase [Macrococcus armenti]|uniref:pyridoxal phosphate-dependent aminotransferase n=1 Tax=Macrococcus armenti TaxID=2875764 RepID=UPI001CCFD423|nr:aminotransferase class I/II-fold pyridoxal phosphate-dependent enzyme [Macrococcus armenti]UBH08171.1 aminotransferase class I/II-fold pyridoxal phosphate-dependent enzyme [Macrococcus armenti]UBH10402.1 aminotransferase class I/II-fold pyridoxal phosphate-dependent enzyme [Macrococcus armenti]UBH14932.1 aminotransferase class I/II-fold pyridoxal phosphate-dependent enzyme [Macrococcus armenti]UBH17292.1 aminotransferase class I/II-fold pyridoxal phosphate-dependent enzyme [Macrococcus armen